MAEDGLPTLSCRVMLLGRGIDCVLYGFLWQLALSNALVDLSGLPWVPEKAAVKPS